MPRMARDATFPAEDLRLAERHLRTAYAALEQARDAVNRCREPEFTAMGMPDKTKLELCRDDASRLRGDIETAIARIEHIRSSGGCGPTSCAARRRS
jgi:hypothetical protein